MTTTAEKIVRFRQRLDQIENMIQELGKDLALMRFEELKPHGEDAARLRYLMTMDGVAWQPPGEGWLNLVKGSELREEIDKAMED